MDLPPTTMAGHPSNHPPNGPGSAESTPRSGHQADWDEPLAQVPGAKLRLMCSYGGHIIPRPHDKSLCYVGGETRIVVVERNSTLADLCTRLSRSLLDGRKFTLKYQLPNEELDSLISVATDEDLENMVDEYDRIMAANAGGPLKANSGGSNSRLRLFLFLAKPETAKTMGALLDDAKSETWFVDALNGTNLPRGLSDSAAIDDLLSLGSGTTDPGSVQRVPPVTSDAALQAKNAHQDVHLIQSVMPDAPMIETNTSSFDSSTSSPSMAHLPPIRVRAEDGSGAPREEMRTGYLEEQFSSQLRVTPPLPTTILTPSTIAATSVATTTGGGNEFINLNRVISDDERSDQGAPVAARKPPLPLPLQTMQHRAPSGNFNLPSPDSKHAGGYNLPSPDSVTSESSIASATSFSKAAAHQDPAAQVATLIDSKHPNTNKPNSTEPNTDSPSYTTQSQTTYVYPPPQQQHQDHQQQPQFIQPNVHYIPAHTQIPSYYQPIYATQQPMHPSQVDPQGQYPMYVLSVPQTQPYNMAVQPADQTAMSSLVAPPSSAPQAHPSVYATRAASPNPTQYQPQYVGYNVNPAARPMPGTAANYGNYDYGHDPHQQHLQHHHQVYYTGQLAPNATTTATPVAPSQYQSMTPAQAAMIAEASMQMPTTDSSKQPPRTS